MVDAKPSPTPKHFGLEALSTLVGLAPRTVRYYIQLGLVDHPEGEKRGAYYTQRHVEQLVAVRRWTDAGVALERVRELVQGANTDVPPRQRSGSVEVWSRIHIAPGLELHVEPSAAGLRTEDVRELVNDVLASYAALKKKLNEENSK